MVGLYECERLRAPTNIAELRKRSTHIRPLSSSLHSHLFVVSVLLLRSERCGKIYRQFLGGGQPIVICWRIDRRSCGAQLKHHHSNTHRQSIIMGACRIKIQRLSCDLWAQCVEINWHWDIDSVRRLSDARRFLSPAWSSLHANENLSMNRAKCNENIGMVFLKDAMGTIGDH